MQSLDQDSLNPDPVQQFTQWRLEAAQAGVHDPENMALATATTSGRPSLRMVILKAADQQGFVFVTHYQSRKGMELEANPQAALLLFWPELRRQVRIEGRVERVSDLESDALFDARAFTSRVSAIASPQSQVVASRSDLERRVQEVLAHHRQAGGRLRRPAEWGGFRVIPETFEFWQNGPHRLHDRFCYRLKAGTWVIERLAP